MSQYTDQQISVLEFRKKNITLSRFFECIEVPHDILEVMVRKAIIDPAGTTVCPTALLHIYPNMTKEQAILQGGSKFAVSLNSETIDKLIGTLSEAREILAKHEVEYMINPPEQEQTNE